MFLIQTFILSPSRSQGQGTSFCIWVSACLAIIVPSYNRVTKLELEFFFCQLECETGYLNASTKLQSTKSWEQLRAIHTSPPYGKLSVLLDIFKLCNETYRWNGRDAVRAHLELMLGWLTMQGKEKLVDKCFIAGNVVMQSHTGVSTYHTTIDSFTRQF